MNAFGITDRGIVRKENQDAFRYEMIAKDEVLCAVLCDGMGGAQAGALAANMASDTFMSHASYSVDSSSDASDMQRILVEAVNYANIKVYDRSFADFSCMGMGCTLVAALINSKRCLIANVGDSRAYLISKNQIQQISNDHSLVQELLAKDGIQVEDKLVDCGTLVFDNTKQDVHSGGSGCGCSAITLCGELLNKLNAGKLKRILFCGTGALLSPTSTQQGMPIPGICHAVSIHTGRI